MENLNNIKLFLNRIYYFLFIERFNKKLSIEFPKNIFRWDLIQHIIDKYSYENYLEIGCDKDQSFSKINVKSSDKMLFMKEKSMSPVPRKPHSPFQP